MELLLNFAGALIVVTIACLWLSFGPRRDVRLSTQVIALVLLVLILFPMISMTDDMLAVQNPAEKDVCLRADHWHFSLQAFAMTNVLLLEQHYVEHHSSFLRGVAPGTLPAFAMNAPALAPIDNRPPPTV